AGNVALGNFQDLGEARGVKVAGTSGLDSAVAALSDQRRQPADFKVESDQDEQVGIAQLKQEAGFGFDEVRVLVALGQRLNFHLVAADLLRERGQVSQRGNHLKFFGLRRGG